MLKRLNFNLSGIASVIVHLSDSEKTTLILAILNNCFHPTSMPILTELVDISIQLSDRKKQLNRPQSGRFRIIFKCHPFTTS